MAEPSAPIPAAGAPVSDDELITGEAVALDLRPAGFVLRAAGAAIDVITYLVAYLLIVLLVLSPVASAFLDEGMQRTAAITALVFCIVVVPATVELLTQGRSLGKLAVGARVVRDDGGAIGFRHAFIRAMTRSGWATTWREPTASTSASRRYRIRCSGCLSRWSSGRRRQTWHGCPPGCHGASPSS